MLKSISEITVRYQETDKMGIVHHSVYPIWYEVGRGDFCREMGISYSKMEEIGVMTPLYDLDCRYIKPSRYEDKLTVETSVVELTPFRVKFNYTVYKDSVPINTGSTTHIWVDAEKFKPLNVKKHFPDLYKLVSDTFQ